MLLPGILDPSLILDEIPLNNLTIFYLLLTKVAIIKEI